MPWTAKSFAQKHNHSLKGKAASKAAAQATAMVRAGVPEGEAIATANKQAKRTNGSSPRSREEHIAQRKSQGMTQKDVGAEFGRHRTTIGRVLRQGFNKGGSARD